MELGAVLLLAALVLGAGFFVAIPFIEARRQPALPSDQELSALLAERDRLINALQELDFDYTLGKIPAEAYPSQREALLSRGASVLRSIDARSAAEPLSVSEEPKGLDAETRIEAAVAARRADAASQTVGVSADPKDLQAGQDDDIESRVSARRSARKSQSGGFCPNCGKPVFSSDRFCPHCGKSIKK